MDLNLLRVVPPWDWPEGVGDALRRVLLDDQAQESDRLTAVELAGDCVVMGDDLANALIATLEHPGRSSVVRSRAAISLGPVLEQADLEGFEDEGDDADAVSISEPVFQRIQASLHKLYADAAVPGEVRRSCLEASVRAPMDWHVEAVRAAWQSGEADQRLTAVFCMRYVRGFEREILAALRSDSEDVRYHAVVAAGNIGLDAAWPHVVALLESKRTEKETLLAAIEAAAQIRPHEAEARLFALSESADEDIAEAAQEAMAMAELAEIEEYEPDEGDEDEEDDDTRGR